MPLQSKVESFVVSTTGREVKGHVLAINSPAIHVVDCSSMDSVGNKSKRVSVGGWQCPIFVGREMVGNHDKRKA